MKIYINKILIFCVFLLSGITLWGQYPGGVRNVTHWLKPEYGLSTSTASSSNISKWKEAIFAENDKLEFQYSYVNYGPKTPPILIKGSERFNFRSVPRFNGSTTFLAAGSNGSKIAKDVTVIAVYFARDEKTDSRMYFMGAGGNNPTNIDSRYPAIGVAPGEGGGRVRQGLLLTGTRIDGSSGYIKNTTLIQTTKIKQTSGRSTVFHFNGSLADVVSGAPISDYRFDRGMVLGGGSRDDGFFNGDIGELLIFDRIISDTDRIKIESYLALKYGVTLKYTVDYKYSDGSSMRASRGYSNQIAGLVRDNSSANVAIARSSSDQASLTINTVGSKFAHGTGITKEVFLPNNLSSVITASSTSGRATSKSVSTGGCGYDRMISNKYWSIIPNNLGSEMNLEIRMGGRDFAYEGAGYEVTMLVAKSDTDARAGKWISMIPGIYAGGGLKEHLFRVPISDKDLYVTFAAKVLSVSCEACTSARTSTHNFTSIGWGKGVTSKSIPLFNGVKLDFRYKTYSNNVEDIGGHMMSRGYPRVDGGVLVTKFRASNSVNDKAIMEIKVDKAAMVRFNIYGIDLAYQDTDQVEVIGYCGTDIVYPQISKINSYDSSIRIQGNKVEGVSRSGVNRRQGVVVDFTDPVQRIEVIHKIKTNSILFKAQDIGIGGFSVSCPKVANANADGFELTLQAPEEVSSCSDFDYTFQAWNYSCDPRTVDFENQLPAGLEFVEGGIGSTDFAMKNAVINDYKNTNKVTIKGLNLLPATSTTIRARVRFKPGVTAGVYSNQGTLTYTSALQGKKITMNSCDVGTADSCLPTKVNMTIRDEVLPLNVALSPLDLSCYEENQKITLQAKIKNPSPDFDYEGLEVTMSYNGDFKFNSYTSNATGDIEVYDEVGMHILTGVSIPRNGEVNLSYELQAYDLLKMVEAATGKKYTNVRDITDEDYAKISKFFASIRVQGWTDDECVNFSFEKAFAELASEIPICERKITACYRPGKLGNLTKKNSDFVLVSSLDRSKNGSLDVDSINALLYLESKSKGFVISRMSTTQVLAMASPVEGMLVYDITSKCLKLYNGVKWDCLIQTCPDN